MQIAEALLDQNRNSTVLYRQSHTFPPGDDAYLSVYERRIAQGRAPFSDSRLDRKSRGLSVQRTLESARRHARANKRLGEILVRYVIPDHVEFEISHDPSGHSTIYLDRLHDLAQYLDREWWEVQDFSPASER